MQTFVEIVIAFAAIWTTWWLIRRMLRPRAPAEPAEEPFSLVPASRKHGPKGRSGAVALEEPEDDDITDAFPPREM